MFPGWAGTHVGSSPDGGKPTWAAPTRMIDTCSDTRGSLDSADRAWRGGCQHCTNALRPTCGTTIIASPLPKSQWHPIFPGVPHPGRVERRASRRAGPHPADGGGSSLLPQHHLPRCLVGAQEAWYNPPVLQRLGVVKGRLPSPSVSWRFRLSPCGDSYAFPGSTGAISSFWAYHYRSSGRWWDRPISAPTMGSITCSGCSTWTGAFVAEVPTIAGCLTWALATDIRF